MVGTGFPFYLYRFFCFLTGCGDLGVHFRNIPRSGQGQRPDIRKYHTLDHGGTHCLFISLSVGESRGREHLSFFLCDDVPATSICVETDAGNQREIIGTD